MPLGIVKYVWSSREHLLEDFSIWLKLHRFVIIYIRVGIAVTHVTRFREVTVFSSNLSTFAKLRKATVNLLMLVLSIAWNNSAPTGQIFCEIPHWELSLRSVEKMQV